MDNHGIVLVLLGFALAVAFGAWHALLPGHGKTLMAAYMVGSQTKVRQAVAVGSAVAVMHTASVLGLGLLVITLEQTFRPESLYPWLGLLSGLVAIGLGAYLTIGRLTAWSASHAAEAHEHDHDHGTQHDHAHEHAGHSHGLPEGVSLTSKRGMFALALAGGILPSPSALIVMLGAINAHRVGYGIGLILAFSVGLALALIVVEPGGASSARRHGGPTVVVLGAAGAGALGVGDRRGRAVPRGAGRDPDLATHGRPDQLAVCQTAISGVSGVDPAGSTEIRIRSYWLGSNSSSTTIMPGSGTKSVAYVAWVPESSHTR